MLTKQDKKYLEEKFALREDVRYIKIVQFDQLMRELKAIREKLAAWV